MDVAGDDKHELIAFEVILTASHVAQEASRTDFTSLSDSRGEPILKYHRVRRRRRACQLALPNACSRKSAVAGFTVSFRRM